MFQYDTPCQIKSCTSTARGEDTFCHICRRDLCRPHYDRKRHWCRNQGRPEWFQEASETLADLDVQKLVEEVAALRRGTKFATGECSGDVSDRRDDGGINIHVPIRFEGGEEWLLRIPSFGDKPEPADMVALVHSSEVLTYEALRAAGVAVPEVYSWGLGKLSKSADPCFTHILYEKLAGSPVHELDHLSPHQLDRFIDTYVAQAIKLSEAKFTAVGGLCLDQSGAITVGKLVDVRVSNAPDCDDLGGPFRSTRDRYLYHIEAVLCAIKADMLFRRAPLHAYLAHLEIKDLILASPDLRQSETEFYLKHPDASSDNILATESGAVSGLLDWEWANTTCKTAAFGAPRWAYPDSFYYGDMALSQMELKLCEAYTRQGREDLAHCVKNARVHQLLDGFFETDLYSVQGDLDGFLPYFHAMQATLDPDCVVDKSTSVHQWIFLTEKKYEGDEGLALVKALGQRNVQTRTTSKIAFPLKQAFSRVWNRFRKSVL